MNPDWKKVPSVTTGGKPHFWTRPVTGYHRRLWCAWNRAVDRWNVADYHNGWIVSGAATPEEAMRMADSVMPDHPLRVAARNCVC